MERKSMGAFMAQLRRERGITQRELADRLGVSDKTVSRWERDESTQDLSLIPDIASFFGVTSDELLCGERTAQDKAYEEKKTDGDERFKIMSAIALGGVFLALIVGMAVNFAFLRAYIGFFAGAALLLIAAVVQLVFTGSAISSADQGQRAEAVRLTDRFYGVSAVVLGFLVSLLTAEDAYAGLRWWAFLTYGAIFTAIFTVLWAVIGSYVFGGMLKGAAIPYAKNLHLRRTCVYGMLGVMAVTFLFHALATAGWETSSLAEGTKFEDEASFVSYMEQDIPYKYSGFVILEPATPIEEGTYYNSAGEEISYEEAHTHTIELGDESVTFVKRNEQVATWRYGGDSLFPITVYTYDDFKTADEKIEGINGIFTVVYVLEAIAAVVLYWVRKKRLTA